MLTLLTSTRAFRGHFGVIQRNALHSWTLLQPRPDILLFGNEEGAAEVSKEFGLRHVPEIATNEFGTPLVSEMVRIACREAAHPLVCYVAADNILTGQFQVGISHAMEWLDGREFLLIGRRWDVVLNEPWDFTCPDWELRFQEYARAHGRQAGAGAMEYLLFPKAVDWDMPPFAEGRAPWDGWLLYEARRRGYLTVDASAVITAYHQQHDTSHWKEIGGARIHRVKTEEFRANQRLRGSYTRQYNLYDAQWVLTSRGLEPRTSKQAAKAHLVRAKMFLAHQVHAAEPYSLPLIVSIRAARNLIRSFQA